MTTFTDEELIARITDQESKLQFEQFGNEVALQLGQALLSAAQEQSLAVAIEVTRADQTLFHVALSGTTSDNAEWIKRKNRVVRRFHRSSLFMGAKCRLAGATLEEKYLLPDNTYAAHGGAFPITLRGTGVIGTVTVSGLPQIDDHELVAAVLGRFLSAK